MRSMASLALLFLLPILITAAETRAAQKPNIIFIFVDNRRYYDLGCYRTTEIKTPHIRFLVNRSGLTGGGNRGQVLHPASKEP